jgi:hypothetical protein
MVNVSPLALARHGMTHVSRVSCRDLQGLQGWDGEEDDLDSQTAAVSHCALAD